MTLVKLGTTNRSTEPDLRDDLTVPGHLRELYDQQAITDAERETYWRTQPTEGRIYRYTRGVGDELEQLRVIPFRVWEHRLKLDRAQQAWVNSEQRAKVQALQRVCALCEQVVPAGGWVTISYRGRDLHLCTGDHAVRVQSEIDSMRWANRLNQLLG